MNKNSKIFLAGHRGVAGSAILCRLRSDGYQRVSTAGRTRLDLGNKQHVGLNRTYDWFVRCKIANLASAVEA